MGGPLGIILGIGLMAGAWPLWRAWEANRRTSLSHAVVWGFVAWSSWLGLWGMMVSHPGEENLAMRYLALTLTGCTAVAVLGARRPGVAAWDFVVGGLLAIQLLSLAEGALTGSGVHLGGVRTTFLAGTLAIGVMNYLPTRFGLAAMFLGLGCGLELWQLLAPNPERQSLGILCIGVAFAKAWLAGRSEVSNDNLADGLWIDFRDRYGLVWGQRVREQFNRSAANSNLPVELSWRGLRTLTDSAEGMDDASGEASLAILRALLKRFGPPGSNDTA